MTEECLCNKLTESATVFAVPHGTIERFTTFHFINHCLDFTARDFTTLVHCVVSSCPALKTCPALNNSQMFLVKIEHLAIKEPFSSTTTTSVTMGQEMLEAVFQQKD